MGVALQSTMDGNQKGVGIMMDKFELRSRAAKDVTLGPNGLFGTSWTQIKRYQTEFQKEFCPKCIHFNPAHQTFCEQAYPHVPGATNCKRFGTDLAGVCWAYEARGKRKPREVIEKKSPVLVLPTEDSEQNKLKEQLSFWEENLMHRPLVASLEWSIAEDSTLLYAIILTSLIRKLFETGRVVSWDFFEEIERYFKQVGLAELPGYFNTKFNDACSVVEHITNGYKI